MIAIVDYGVGNLASIKNMLKQIGKVSIISDKSEELDNASKLILPGVGAFDTCAQKLRESGLLRVVEEHALKRKTPILGVCVGMQLLFEGSEEGTLPGLGWIKGRNVRFQKELLPQGYKIPHMGWTDVKVVKPSKLMLGIDTPRFYFVHSYHAITDLENVLMQSDYGYTFTAGVEKENIMGVQFHPEKSHKFGMNLLSNFINNF